MVNKITNAKIINLYLNDYSRRYYLRELASLLKKPHQSIKPYVEELSKEGILVKYHRKNLLEYGLNLKNKQIYEYLFLAEKEKLIERLKKDSLLNILYEKLADYFEHNIFIIFGSASQKLEKGSDIDLLVVGRKNISNEIKDFEEVYNKKIHKVQVEKLSNVNTPLIKEIYKNHLIYNNAEQVIRFFGGLYEKNKLV